MKKLFALIVLLAAFGYFGYTLNTLGYLNPDHLLAVSLCDKPIAYKIGEVDDRFELSREEFTARTQVASQMWNQAYGKPLFIQDPQAELTVNLVYDDRQSLNNQITDLQTQVKSELSDLKERVEDYKQRSAAFDQKIQQFKEEVNYWNQQGGAPQEEYEKIIQKQADLRAEAESLNQEARELNQDQKQHNTQIDQLNNTIDTYNDAIAQKPEEGLYDGPRQRIEIYFNINDDELTHTLAHEFGHALSIEHNSNPKSIMYSFSSKTTQLSAEDLRSLAQVCRPRNIAEVMGQNITTQITKIKESKEN